MKDIGHHDAKPSEQKINILKYKPFYALIIPNFIRGFVLGIIQLAVTIRYYAKVLGGFVCIAMYRAFGIVQG